MQELSVGEFAKYLNQVLASDLILSDVWVTGEVSGARNVRGNMYFDLIDGDVKLPCSLFKTALMRQRVTPEDGQKVSVHGWIYSVSDGLAKDLQVSMSGPHEVVDVFRAAIKRYPRGESTHR